MGQCCLKGSAEFGNPKNNTFKTDGECKKLKRKQGNMGGSLQGQVWLMCVRYADKIVESESGK